MPLRRPLIWFAFSSELALSKLVAFRLFEVFHLPPSFSLLTGVVAHRDFIDFPLDRLVRLFLLSLSVSVITSYRFPFLSLPFFTSFSRMTLLIDETGFLRVGDVSGELWFF